MKTLLTLFIWASITTALNGQIIEGVITDAETNEPLVGANVAIDGTMKGVATDINGNFKIVTDKLPVVVTVSYIGYQTKKITINEVAPSITLQAEEEQLSELVITDKPIIEKVFKKGYSIKDYEFYEDYIILLVYKGYFKKHSLILINMEGEELSELSIKDLKPIDLFAGCLGGVHLLTNTYARQIYILGNSIQFLKKVDTKIFDAQMSPCKDANADYVFYKLSRYANQEVSYLRISKSNPNDKKIIARVTHQENLVLLEDEPSFQKLREYVAKEHGSGQPKSSSFGDEMIEGDFVSRVIYKPIYVPMFEYRDTVYVFDHVYGKIKKLDLEGNKITGCEINYHKNNKWRKKLIFDQERGKAYTFIDTKWAMTLHQINLETGKISAPLILDRPHISNIKVKDGFVYFLYFAPQHGENVKKLEKMRIY